MKETGILFSASMVRALLDGSKRQTRRIVKPQFSPDAVPAEMCAETAEGWQTTGHSGLWWCDAGGIAEDAIRCPYGIPGDRLWVRETFFAYGRWETRYSEKKKRDEWHFVDMTPECDRLYQYAADNPDLPLAMFRDSVTPQWWKRPAIFMPRAASRILLDVTRVRVERLQEISEADARDEGIKDGGCVNCGDPEPCGCLNPSPDPRDAYLGLWEDINGVGAWAGNPWVWVVEFRRVTP